MRAFLGLGRARAVGPFRARENAAGGENQDVAIGEFLFEFAGQAVGRGVVLMKGMWIRGEWGRKPTVVEPCGSR